MKNHFFARKFYFIVKHCYIDAIWRLSKKSIYIEFPPSPSLHGTAWKSTPPRVRGELKGVVILLEKDFSDRLIYIIFCDVSTIMQD